MERVNGIEPSSPFPGGSVGMSQNGNGRCAHCCARGYLTVKLVTDELVAVKGDNTSFVDIWNGAVEPVSGGIRNWVRSAARAA